MSTGNSETETNADSGSWYTLTPEQIVESLVGCAQAEIVGTTVVPSHFSSWVTDRVGSESFRIVASTAGGSRLSLTTRADTIRAVVALERFSYGDNIPPALFVAMDTGTEWAAVELGPDLGRAVWEDENEELHSRTGPTATVEFVRPPHSESDDIDIYLPSTAAVTLMSVTADKAVGPRHARPARRWLHHGSSISQGGNLIDPRLAWPVAAADALGVEVINASLPGNSLLDPCVAEELASLDADVVSLELGINVVNWDSHIERTFVPALHGFLDQFYRSSPDRPLILISPFSCSIFEHSGGPIEMNADGIVSAAEAPRDTALTLSRVRELITSVLTVRREHTVHFVDGLSLFGADDESALEDRLHPNAAGTALIADRFVAAVRYSGGPLAALFEP